MMATVSSQITYADGRDVRRMDPLQLSIDPQQLGIEFGSGAVIGGIIGFAAKKIAKLIAVIVGLELAVFKFLESRGIITVDWERLTGGLVSATQDAATGAPPDWISTILSTLSVSAGFSGGFLVGFKKG
ncbi:putative membrane protein, Fun14 family [Haloferax volcanii]|nr:putative membrane protein, Fun14 family [Haloferax alexandrinus]